ncbi:MAG: hypothetical protein IT337_05980 [Thermomicrobiales bacterium]|nr:hypothetical protein [Thermomicrobiales bacterium]
MSVSRPADERRFHFPTEILSRVGISLLLAALLWGWVTTQRDPTLTRTINGVPIVAPTLPEPLQIGGELGAVNLQLEGPRSAIDAISRTDLEPTLDMSQIDGPGDYTAPVVVSLPPAVRAQRIDPPRLSIVVDETATRSMPLQVRPVAPDDGTRRIGAITPDVSEVTVSGPRRLVDQVARVVLPIDIGDRTSDFTGQFTTVALNADGQPIPEVDIRPRRVLASVAVSAKGRAVPVLIQIVGSPAPGYEVGDDVVNPPTALLDGPEDVLGDLVSVLTEPINVQGAVEPVSVRVGLEGLPPGVRVIEPPDGRFTVVIQVRQRGVTQTLPDQPVVATDLAPGLETTIDPPAVGVVIFAAEDTLATLRTGQVVVSVSAAGLAPGTYQLPLSVAVPPEVQWIRTQPGFVRVTVHASTGATPAAVGATPLPEPPREIP